MSFGVWENEDVACRRMEMEADLIGLHIMAESCFDPRGAIGILLALLLLCN